MIITRKQLFVKHKKILHALILLSVFSIPFSWIFNTGVRLTITTTEILFSLAFLVWFFETSQFRNKTKFTPLGAPIALFLGICILSSLFAQNKFVACRETLQFVWLFGIYYLILHFAEDRKDVCDILVLGILAGTIISVLGLYQYRFTNEPYYFRIGYYRLRAYATFGQPNAFGGYLIGLIPITIGLTIHNSNGKWKLAMLLSLFIMSLSLFATFSRGSWIGLLGGLGIMFKITHKRLSRKSLFLPLFIVLLAASVIFGDMYFTKPEVTKPEVTREIFYRHFSNTQRLLLAKSALAMTRDHPIVGVGLGNFSVLLPQYASGELIKSAQLDFDKKTGKWFTNPSKKIDIQIVHNMFLQISAETGLLGLAIYLWLLYAYYKSSFKLLGNHAINTREYAIRAGLIGSFTAIMISGVFGWPFSHGVQEILVLSIALSLSPWGISNII